MARSSQSPNPFLKALAPTERRKHLLNLQVTNSNAPQRSLLHQLPPELRNKVYELVLVSNNFIELDVSQHIMGIMTRSRYETAHSKAVAKEPGFLQCCRLIRNEATLMYYGQNRFACQQDGRLLHWVRGLSEAKRNMLKDLRSFARSHWRGWSVHPRDRRPPRLLLSMDILEVQLARDGLTLGVDVLRVYRNRIGPITALTRLEIKERMTEEQLRTYEEVREATTARRQLRSIVRRR